ncbi:immunoglobulin-like domain-containing protein [Planococcus salinus]|uniref:Bacterial Ig-like domain-containing protein n=1 Tax=Planococcus salinus TaxID=1848460 RepID=A0A3M8PEJ9_9BACL|nr:immunoglobulin-like domain-containing protein [Planococcus salinus]RNF41224.1 hypothetical protein EEX84_02440 [Planococcus salinus]
MNKKVVISIAVLFLAGLTAAFMLFNEQEVLKEEAEVQELPSSKDGIEIRTEKDAYTTSTDRIVLVITNNSEETLGGTLFEVEKKAEGQWYKFPLKESGPIEAVGRSHPPNNTSTITLFTDELKYDLSQGAYRATFAGMAANFEVIE